MGCVAGALYAFSLVALLGTSATYHRITWSDVARARMTLVYGARDEEHNEARVIAEELARRLAVVPERTSSESRRNA